MGICTYTIFAVQCTLSSQTYMKWPLDLRLSQDSLKIFGHSIKQKSAYLLATHLIFCYITQNLYLESHEFKNFHIFLNNRNICCNVLLWSLCPKMLTRMCLDRSKKVTEVERLTLVIYFNL